MRISDFRGIWANIMEVPEDYVSLGKTLWRGKDFFKQAFPKMLTLLVRATALGCIWEEFEEELERKGREMSEDFTLVEWKLLRSLTKRHFSSMRIPKTHQGLREDIEGEKRTLLEALDVLEKELFPQKRLASG